MMDLRGFVPPPEPSYPEPRIMARDIALICPQPKGVADMAFAALDTNPNGQLLKQLWIEVVTRYS